VCNKKKQTRDIKGENQRATKEARRHNQQKGTRKEGHCELSFVSKNQGGSATVFYKGKGQTSKGKQAEILSLYPIHLQRLRRLQKQKDHLSSLNPGPNSTNRYTVGTQFRTRFDRDLPAS
jgi:hypothetical protein